ncbi:MAG: glycerophosphoryl diester phosphodiesterase [Candidatus Paceibacteria bacterium]|jgi:glycerophosphoryl diester phosphodiesterase
MSLLEGLRVTLSRMTRPTLCLLFFFTSCAAVAPAAAPMIIAHRGASFEAPENTLASYALAVEQGAQLAECDVYLTKDGVPVLFHDADLNRTTNGTGPIVESSLAELKQLDAGSWKGARYSEERIPTLVEFLLAVKGQLRPVIEVKGKDRNIEGAIIAALNEAKFPPEDVMMFSFHYKVLAELARQEPSLPTTWLVTPPAAGEDLRPFFHVALKARLSAIGVAHKHVTKELLRRAHESGLAVYVWTVNDQARMVELASMGVDAIITDRPALARASL